MEVPTRKYHRPTEPTFVMLVSFLVCCYSIILDFIAFLCLCATSSPSAHFRVDRNCPPSLPGKLLSCSK